MEKRRKPDTAEGPGRSPLSGTAESGGGPDGGDDTPTAVATPVLIERGGLSALPGPTACHLYVTLEKGASE